jgi:SAM-dependent methyltransferase
MNEQAPRGRDYDARFDALIARGENVHGEADFVEAYRPTSVLDAGCGTGRVAIELARRGIEAVGVDIDHTMLAIAREKAPDQTWHLEDLARVELGRVFDVVIACGNVMIFLTPGTEQSVVERLGAHVRAGGLLITGFSLEEGRLDLDHLDRYARGAGLALKDRYATWAREPFVGGRYAVSVFERERTSAS